MKRIVLTIVAASLLQACGSVPVQPTPGEREYAPVIARDEKPLTVNKGSIYQPTRPMNLFSDRRSNQVGDIITIVLQERTQASKSADTSTNKNTTNNLQTPNLLDRYADLSQLTDVNHDRTFAGGASSDQSNSLTGSISVTVSEVLPNGVLAVRGEKWMTLNRGEEFIRIRGLIRPEDISDANTIPSTKLADARITYSGTGELAATNQQGWLTRFFNSPIWPF